MEHLAGIVLQLFLHCAIVVCLVNSCSGRALKYSTYEWYCPQSPVSIVSPVSVWGPPYLAFPPHEAAFPFYLPSPLDNWRSLFMHEFTAVLEFSINFHWNKPDQARRPWKRLPYRVHLGTSAFRYNDGLSVYRDLSEKYITAIKTFFVKGISLLIKWQLSI